MEFVYVVTRAELFERGTPRGFERLDATALAERYLRTIAERGFFVERRRAEVDPSLKQIIPYCVVACGGEVLALRRHRSQGEARLHDKLSIGVGGHLNPVDAESLPARGVLEAGAARELAEELTGVTASPMTVGVINDDSNAVGAVHFGIVLVASHPAMPAPRRPAVLETDRMTGEWSSWEGLRERLERGADFESWSSLVLRSWAPSERHELLSSSVPSPLLRVPDAIGSSH